MPKNTHRKGHKEKVNIYKNKIKEMSKQQNNIPQMPEVRNVPVWDKNADIIIKGFEWEVIFNTIGSLQVLNQAASSVMSRNIINGIIGMDFQKLDPKTLDYVEMSDEEKVPYNNDFNSYLDKMRNLPKQTGNATVDPTVEEKVVATEEHIAPVAKQEAKVVEMV